MQVVIFKLNNEQFAVQTDKIQSINDAMEITRVPKAPAHIKGLINLRGNIISLLDINLLLDIPKGDKIQNNIIILEMEDELVGIAVDDVYEVLDVEENLIERSSDERRKEYIEGIINFQDRIVTLIDIDKLL
ncbi:chemotaxis protein CheW [Clostridium botulinum]|uniref:Putative chemotaxis protein CheW n=1 Tax=Clostridium botulinum (strain Langeland / NCTC 10281 / Type F) TaxID=441772 RepID=A7GGW3_CLOBL|nr:chemotaxis protein CheW [Clostridium botulinum]ABS40048.1 putative chemotaxis protein CheW [Clostridium botulinum F str. Langeland]ADG00416.1 putative chemotaxis protein CheW [Clostridium botulinum F str. 230613]KKM41093.1 chemotaxis protein CheW [Clostridium botulinum]MBY6792643.1 chemotaxis protein CheW [Clostridium botulinum]MBY6937714.1 chemotaxis protein CheW [Clostridium botulinum]